MNKKIIWKLNIIDLLIITLLLISLTALVYRLTWGSGGDEQIFEITYICDEASIELLRDIRSGDECSDWDLGTELGRITGASSEALPDAPDKGRAYIKTSVEGVKSSHGTTIGDSVYLKGKNLNLIVGDSVFEVYISNIIAVE